jgi:hypothetical protein
MFLNQSTVAAFESSCWFNYAKLSLALLIEPKCFCSGYPPEMVSGWQD